MHVAIARLARDHDRLLQSGADGEAHPEAVAVSLVSLRLLDGHAARHELPPVALQLGGLALSVLGNLFRLIFRFRSFGCGELTTNHFKQTGTDQSPDESTEYVGNE